MRVSSDALTGRDNLKDMAAIVTFAMGQHAAYLPLIEPSLREYAHRYKYDVIIHSESADESRPPAWSKVKFLLEALANYDEIMWIDSDALLVDVSRDLKKDIQRKTEMAWAIHHIRGEDYPNSGVLFLRSTPRTSAFLAAVYEQEDLIDHPWWENAAMIRLLGYQSSKVDEGRVQTPMDLNVQHLDWRWNSIRQAMEWPVRVRHFAGDAAEVRAIGMAELVLMHPGLEGIPGIEGARVAAKQLILATQKKIRQARHSGARLRALTDSN